MTENAPGPRAPKKPERRRLAWNSTPCLKTRAEPVTGADLRAILDHLRLAPVDMACILFLCENAILRALRMPERRVYLSGIAVQIIEALASMTPAALSQLGQAIRSSFASEGPLGALAVLIEATRSHQNAAA